MWILMKLAWRNLFRNTRRTILAGIAIGMGLAGLMFTDALVIGLSQNMVMTATETSTGHGQAENPSGAAS